MKKHKFTDEEHFAIWRAYGQKCFYCEQSLSFAEITIDHLIPERLLDDTEQLQSIKSQYGLVLATWVICSQNRHLQHDLTSPPPCKET